MNMKKPALLIVLLLFGAVAVHAQTPYYQGKTIRIVTGYPAGDVNDLWPRLIAQHMTKYSRQPYLHHSKYAEGKLLDRSELCLRRGQAGRA